MTEVVVLEEPTYLTKKVHAPSKEEEARHPVSIYFEDGMTDVIRVGDQLFPSSIDGHVQKVAKENIEHMAAAFGEPYFPYSLHRKEARGFWDILSDEEKAVLLNSGCGPTEIAVSLEDKGLLAITEITQQNRHRLAFFEGLAFFELTTAGQLVHEKHFVVDDPDEGEASPCPFHT